MFCFKFVYGTEIRRISVQNAVSVEELRALAQSLFENGISKDYVFQYRDDEGDNVTISSDRELSEAFRLFHSGAIIRFTIAERMNRKTEEPAVKAEKIEMKDEKKEGCEAHRCEKWLKFRAHRAVCDECSVRIRGIRWKCTECPDFDLCDSCRSKNIHSQHEFSKIELPLRNAARFKAFKLQRLADTEIPKPVELKKEEVTAVTTLEEKKPEQTKPEEKKPEEKKPEEKKPEEKKPEEKKPEEKKPEQTKPEEKKPEEKKPEDKKAEKQEHPFESKLKQLEEMGFTERSVNIALLVQYGGDLLAVVRDLLG